MVEGVQKRSDVVLDCITSVNSFQAAQADCTEPLDVSLEEEIPEDDPRDNGDFEAGLWEPSMTPDGAESPGPCF